MFLYTSFPLFRWILVVPVVCISVSSPSLPGWRTSEETLSQRPVGPGDRHTGEETGHWSLGCNKHGRRLREKWSKVRKCNRKKNPKVVFFEIIDGEDGREIPRETVPHHRPLQSQYRVTRHIRYGQVNGPYLIPLTRPFCFSSSTSFLFNLFSFLFHPLLCVNSHPKTKRYIITDETYVLLNGRPLSTGSLPFSTPPDTISLRNRRGKLSCLHRDGRGVWASGFIFIIMTTNHARQPLSGRRLATNYCLILNDHHYSETL